MSEIIASLAGVLLGSLVTLWARQEDQIKRREERKAADRVERQQRTLERFDRFNGSEVMRARQTAETLLAREAGIHQYDMRRLSDEDVAAFWIVVREYEVLEVGLAQGVLDWPLAAELFPAIYAYWWQHFRFAFAGTGFEVEERLVSLRDRFARADPAGWDEWQERARDVINSIRVQEGMPDPFDFTADPVVPPTAAPVGGVPAG